MNDHSNPSDWRMDQVDASSDPARMVRFLDATRSVRPYKRDFLSTLELRPGDNVLDLGCGTGDDARVFAEFVGSTGRMVGIDLSQTMIDTARTRSEHSVLPVEFYVADIHHLPFDNHTFDAIYAARVFQHIAHPRQALYEAIRVAKLGGHISIADPDYGTEFFNVPDRELFEVVQAAYQRVCVDQFQFDPWAGRKRYREFHEAGLEQVVVKTFVRLATTFTELDAFLDLSSWGVLTFEQGLISKEDHDRWINAVKDHRASGIVLAGVTYFCTSGVVPIDPGSSSGC